MPSGVICSGAPYPWAVEMWSIRRAWFARACPKAEAKERPHVTNTPSTAGCFPTWLEKELYEPPLRPVKTPPPGGSSTCARAPAAAEPKQPIAASAQASRRRGAAAPAGFRAGAIKRICTSLSQRLLTQAGLLGERPRLLAQVARRRFSLLQ